MLALTLGTMLVVCAGLYTIIGSLRDNIQTMYEHIRTGAEQTIEDGLQDAGGKTYHAVITFDVQATRPQ